MCDIANETNSVQINFDCFRLTEGEEIIREHLRNLREAETRLSVMEKENLELRDKVNIVMRQNEHLERLNRILEKPEVSTEQKLYTQFTDVQPSNAWLN